jgi:hypothetical protein
LLRLLTDVSRYEISKKDLSNKTFEPKQV